MNLSMSRQGTVAIALTIAFAIIGVGLVIWFMVSGTDGKPGTAPAAAPTATLIDRGDGVIPVDKEGQAADGGDFETLVVPDGVDSGIGLDLPADQLTQPGADLGAGSLVIANLFQSDANANPYVMLVVDEFSDPLAGADREKAFAEAGVSDDGARIVQKVTLRIRQIAGTGKLDDWNLARSIVPVNLKMETMTVIDIPSAACGNAKTPLAGHEGSTNDTVQTCFYVFGSVNTPASPIGSLSIAVRMDGKTQYLYIQSDKGLDLDLEDAHEHDHDDQWWEVDPETGAPLVDPKTGQVVPKEGHEDHDH
ncbi:MAG: hypothetical protein J0J04_04810 [Microbacterium sp.]|uniref:hypothetical protein n=1 Tax=Microbacterium sp. TaxID=51671 RepID=UPI001ACAC7E1|nr:hypothetical protein [Microbacterium sp.]MBN9214129.1 hypothetical protein [Microbacterium sp.]